MSIANANYREGIAYSPDGAMYVTATGSAAITGGTAKFDDGAAATPSVAGTNYPTSGLYWASGVIGFSIATAETFRVNASGPLANAYNFGIGFSDVSISRVSANILRFSSAGATTTSRTEVNKAVASIANTVATDVLTVTIPNAAHSASLLVRVTGSLGAGGAIGANEATATNSYIIGITRTAGVATVATASAVFGAVAVAVAGAATVTATATVTAMTGAVGATQTFTVQITITRSGGASDNHTCLVYAQLMNANITGITLA